MPLAAAVAYRIEHVLRLVVLAVADERVDLAVIADEFVRAASAEVGIYQQPRLLELLELARAVVALLARLEPLFAVQVAELFISRFEKLGR